MDKKQHLGTVRFADIITDENREAFEGRFRQKLRRNKNGCDIWTGMQNEGGYGRFSLDGRIVMAHRLSHYFATGEDTSLHMRHLCGEPSCARPEHLEPGTAQQNADDQRLHRKTKVDRRLLNRKFDEQTVVAIREAYHAGESQQSVARRFDANPSTIGMVCRGDSYEDFGGPITRDRVRKPLSKSEIAKIEALAAEGYSARDIAKEMGLSPTTTKRYRSRWLRANPPPPTHELFPFIRPPVEIRTIGESEQGYRGVAGYVLPNWESLYRRIFSRVEVDEESGCWIFTGSKQKGYGAVKASAKNRPSRVMRTHRVVRFMVTGEDCLVLLRHSCDTRACCNPDHLSPGSYQDNANDRVPPRGEELYNALLTNAQARELREDVADGMAVPDAMRKYGLDATLVSRVCRGQSYAEAGGPLTRFEDAREGVHELFRELHGKGLTNKEIAVALERAGIRNTHGNTYQPSVVWRIIVKSLKLEPNSPYLDEQTASAVRRAVLDRRETGRQIAARLNVSKAVVSDIRRGKTWQHVAPLVEGAELRELLAHVDDGKRLPAIRRALGMPWLSREIIAHYVKQRADLNAQLSGAA